MSQIFSPEFLPILLPNETAVLHGTPFPTGGQPVKCRWVGALPEYAKDFGALTAVTWLTNQEDENLELSSLELGQWRIRVLDNIQVRINNPPSVEQWRTAKTRFYITQFPTEPGQNFLKELAFRMSEFFTWEDQTARFELYSQLAAGSSRILFSGWRFAVEKIAAKDLTSKMELWVDSWPGGK